MDFEVRMRVIFQQIENTGELSAHGQILLDECRQEVRDLLQEIDEMKKLAYGSPGNSDLISRIFYYSENLRRYIDEIASYSEAMKVYDY